MSLGGLWGETGIGADGREGVCVRVGGFLDPVRDIFALLRTPKGKRVEREKARIIHQGVGGGKGKLERASVCRFARADESDGGSVGVGPFAQEEKRWQ